jgi:oligopeptide/dipeptide ABC transporter ATP-binding protein
VSFPVESEARSSREALLDVRDLQTHFVTRRGVGKPVDGVSFTVKRGETLGLVGESGSGKSMTCLSIVRLHPRPASRIVGGEVRFRGVNLLTVPEDEMRTYRGRHIAFITQDPGAALNPVFTIGDQLMESLKLRDDRPRGGTLRSKAIDLLKLLRIPAPESRLRSYPHQFSGGMRQRAVGAIAMSRDPELIIADEPTTALDATIQAAYLEVLKDLQQRYRLAIILVTHDFSIVAQMCDRVAVMYAGQIVEMADKATLFAHAGHPYTTALLTSVPDVQVAVKRLPSIEGQPPSIFEPPSGCRFHPRCPLRQRLGNPARCANEAPALRELRSGQTVRCHFAEENRQAPVDASAGTSGAKTAA